MLAVPTVPTGSHRVEHARKKIRRSSIRWSSPSGRPSTCCHPAPRSALLAVCCSAARAAGAARGCITPRAQNHNPAAECGITEKRTARVNDREKYERAVQLQQLQQALKVLAKDPERILWRQIKAGIFDVDRLEEIERLVDEDLAALEFEQRYADYRNSSSPSRSE
jgi:hypothetical protein